VQASGGTAVPELKKVIVAFGGDVAMGDTLLDALTQIFDTPEDVQALSQILGQDLTEPANTDQGGGTPPAGGDQTTEVDTIASLLADADDLLNQANDALKEGDLGKYQDKVKGAQEKIMSALDLANQSADGGSGSNSSDSGGGGPGTDGSTTTTAPPETTSTAEPDQA
jgi:uncharacterized protein